jgi:uncharacterized protein (TIGR02246 family)
MTRRVLATLALLPLLAGCATLPPGLAEDQRTAIRTEVEASMTAFMQTWADADFDRAIMVYDDHPDFAFASNTSTWSSRPAVEAAYRPGFRTIERQDFGIEEMRIAVLAADVAHVTLRGHFDVTRTDGSVSPRQRIAFTGVWVNRGGEWKVRFAHQSMRPVNPTAAGGANR